MMDLDKLQQALADPETAELFAKRKEALEAIEVQERELQLGREGLAEIEAAITERLGVSATTTNGKKQMTCSRCGEKGHNKKGCLKLKEA